MTETSSKNPSEPSTNIMLSYGSGKFLVEFFSAAFSVLVFKYYETNLQLDPLLAGLGIIIYSIYNAINDPIVGYFTIRPTRFAKKFGRRFPWIVFGCFIWVFTIILIFIVPSSYKTNPENHQFGIFLWMALSVCIHDTFFSIWELNYQSLFPDKFRGNNIRSKAAGLATIVGVLGIALGNLLPTFIIPSYEDTGRYVLNAIVFAAIALVIFFLMLPGVREDPVMIERYLQSLEDMKSNEEKEASFFTQLKGAFKQKNFVAFILFYFLYQACTMSLSASVDYIADYLLPGEKSDTTIIFAGMLVGALISVPFWGFIAKKIQSNQKALILSAFVLIAGLVPMIFAKTYVAYTIAITIFGMGFGGYWFLITPCMADVIDEVVVNTGKRNDGIYMGFRAFFGRLSYAVQASSFAIVHTLTNFDNRPNVDQSTPAQWGIRIHSAILPIIFMLLGVLIFWKMNTLNPEKMKVIHQKLDEMDL
ncbi:hypothetical protein NEF87_002411 [Candidatus Lokiarchaeum ossiferum]|uniref:MFS transporter n=1 Tax=Candidatus Lokiarchaeum ossiferum TaxID=2951803 RepID=A0ABY6HU82_9ARCH|nr:hypothetical protein NEF87_002411 [Candidatus Lokiarchaeum sp. B-35]